MKKIYFVFTILIIFIFSFDFSFADGKSLTLPISPKTFIDAGVPANSKLFVFQGLCFGFNDSYLTFKEDIPVTFYTFYKSGDDGYDDYTMTYKHDSYEKDNKVIQYTFCNRYPNSLPAFINGNEIAPSTGGVTIKEHITPSVYYFDGENVNLIEGEDIGGTVENEEYWDDSAFGSKIRIIDPKNNSVVWQSYLIRLNLLDMKKKFFNPGYFLKSWDKKLSSEDYKVRFYVNDIEVDLLQLSKVQFFDMTDSMTKYQLHFPYNFTDNTSYKLKAELYYNDNLVSWHKIVVRCQSSFVDKNGDGYDDNTGAKIPGAKLKDFGAVGSFFEFILSFFTSLFDVLKRVTQLLKEFVAGSSEFAKILVSIFSSNPTISSIFILSLTVAVFLRIVKR